MVPVSHTYGYRRGPLSTFKIIPLSGGVPHKVHSREYPPGSHLPELHQIGHSQPASWHTEQILHPVKKKWNAKVSCSLTAQLTKLTNPFQLKKCSWTATITYNTLTLIFVTQVPSNIIVTLGVTLSSSYFFINYYKPTQSFVKSLTTRLIFVARGDKANYSSGEIVKRFKLN